MFKLFFMEKMIVDETKKDNDKLTSDEGHKPSKKSNQTPKEVGGREGPDPVRYGDWENNGIASDF